MRIYVVVGVHQGAVSEVKGFFDPGEADAEAIRLQGENPEGEVQLHEVDVDARPVSVMVRRQIW